MTKNIVVPGSTPVSVEVANLIEERNIHAKDFGSTYGGSGRYAAAMLKMFAYDAAVGKPLCCKESGAEFEAWKAAATIAATKLGRDINSTPEVTARFKASLTDKVREIRKQARILCGLETSKGASVTRDIYTRITEDATKLYKALMAAELATQWSIDDLANLGSILKRHKVDVTTLG